MTDQLKIEEGTSYSQPHFFITNGEYNQYQRWAPNVSNPNPLSGEEKMLVALCEKVLHLERVRAAEARVRAAEARAKWDQEIHLCQACDDNFGVTKTRGPRPAIKDKEHCSSCGKYSYVWKFTRDDVMAAVGKNIEETGKAKKHYYTLTANTHENKVKILEWMEDSMAEMDAGNAGWIEETVLYPNAVYRKLVTDKDGVLTDPEYISKLVQDGRAQLRKDPSCDWGIAVHYGVEYITQRLKEGTQYTVREDGHALPKN